jgi:CRISPR/Cas system-associated protein Cas7 (RAMP superfamily)
MKATGRFGARMKTMRPMPAVTDGMRSVHTRPIRSTSGPPRARNTVIETEKTVRKIAPVASDSW